MRQVIGLVVLATLLASCTGAKFGSGGSSSNANAPGEFNGLTTAKGIFDDLLELFKFFRGDVLTLPYDFNQSDSGLASRYVKVVEFGNDNEIYIGTAGGFSFSLDGGNTFKTRTRANGIGSNQVNAIVLRAGKIYLGTDGGVSVSEDGGYTFTNYRLSLQPRRVKTLAIRSNGRVYAGTPSGLYHSHVDSLQDFSINHNLMGVKINDIYEHNDKLYISTGTAGVAFTPNADSGALQFRNSSQGLPDVGLSAVRISPSGRVFVVTDIGIAYTDSPDLSGFTQVNFGMGRGKSIDFVPEEGTLVATDRGVYFSDVDTPENVQSLNLIPTLDARCIRVNSEGRIAIATGRGLFLLDHYEDSPEPIVPDHRGLRSTSIKSVRVTSKGIIYASTTRGLSISDNGGARFTTLGDFKVNASASYEGRTYLATATRGLLMTAGEDFEPVFPNYQHAKFFDVKIGKNGTVYGASQVGFHIRKPTGEIQYNPQGVGLAVEKIHLGLDGKIYLTKQLEILILNSDLSLLTRRSLVHSKHAILGNDGRIYVARRGGISVSSDGTETFEDFNLTMFFNQVQFNYVAEGPNGKLYLAADDGLYVFKYGEDNRPIKIRDGSFKQITIFENRLLFAASPNGILVLKI